MTLEEHIRDQFMLKCSSNKVRQELWSKDDPSLQEVVTIAKSVEHTLACVEELERSKCPAVNKISQKNEQQDDHKDSDGGKDEAKLSQIQKSKFKDTKCFRCENLGHYASYKKCPAVNAICKLCNKHGHFAKCYRSQKVSPSVKVVEDCILMVDAQGKKKKHPEDFVTMCGIECEVLFDSGASLILLSDEVFEGVMPQKDLVGTIDKMKQLCSK
ncbi:hypothetical protein NDU88_005815 [Pleurodeles waltl]|uniref:Uncharacterized protein n=1 Tax=Pleurodeles waltl TaxID=8319 RepID=A0AAV7PLI9_PLEWA|nr:hypothetical protein NDU88_005815 [Pleurodeles waltl]